MLSEADLTAIEQRFGYQVTIWHDRTGDNVLVPRGFVTWATPAATDGYHLIAALRAAWAEGERLRHAVLAAHLHHGAHMARDRFDTCTDVLKCAGDALAGIDCTVTLLPASPLTAHTKTGDSEPSHA